MKLQQVSERKGRGSEKGKGNKLTTRSHTETIISKKNEIPVELSFSRSSLETREAKISQFVTLSYSCGLLQYKSEAPGAGKNFDITAITMETS